ncbi:MAG: hypothetical protein HC877_23470 [Thioploca sp.]|nr:hypothetical protein [Thioploca sp.]
MKILIILLITLNLCWTKAEAQLYKTVKNPFRFHPHRDNKIYKVGRSFIYDYKVVCSELEGKVYVGDIRFDKMDWEIGTSVDSIDKRMIEQIRLDIVKRKLFKRVNFGQTQINYKLVIGKGGITIGTGLIETKKNIWLHPFRDESFFRILQIAPFPYIRLPLEIGNHWEDVALAGSYFGDEKWATWEGILNMKVSYEVVGKEKMSTPIGDQEVFKIQGVADSDIGISTLDIFFQEEIGIVKLIYNILDKYQINIVLIKNPLAENG